jgi:hypothetical protein
MDVLIFNTSSNQPQTVGGSLCHYKDSTFGGTGGQFLLSIGGTRSFSQCNKSNSDRRKVQQKQISNYLQVDVLDIKSAKWKPEYIVTNTIKNRAYHGVAVVMQTATALDNTQTGNMIQQSVLIFGGGELDVLDGSSSPTLTPAKEVVQLEKGLFGYKANTIFSDTERKLAYLGLTTSTVGSQLDRVLIFGGHNSIQGQYNQELHIFSAHPATLKPIDIDPTSVLPSPRAYHTALVLGEQNQYVLVIGGQNEQRQMLDELWLLDLTDVLQAEYKPESQAAIDPKARAKSSSKNKDNKPAVYARWQQLSLPSGVASSFTARSRHTSYHVPVSMASGQLEYDIFILGGLSNHGLLAVSEYVQARLSIFPLTSHPASPPATKSTPAALSNMGPKAILQGFEELNTFPACSTGLQKDVAADSMHASQLALTQLASMKAMAMSCCLIYATDFDPSHIQSLDTPLGWLLTGGYHILPSQSAAGTVSANVSSVTLIARDIKHPFIKKIRKIIQRNYILEGNPILNVKNDADSNRLKSRRIDFSNGDVYEGQVISDEPDTILGTESQSVEYMLAALDMTDEEEEDECKGIEGLHFPHGKGAMRCYGGTRYEGDWRNGQRQGEGKLYYPNEDVYDGHFMANLPEGEGSMVTQTPFTEYTGSFRQGYYDGIGELRMPEHNEVYRGHFQEGLKHGDGVISYLGFQGDVIGEAIGCWIRDKMTGLGKGNQLAISSLNLLLGYISKEDLLRDEDISSINRSRRDLQLPAQALLPQLSRTVNGHFTGPLLDGVPEGDDGVCTYINGASYIGQWRKGRRNGTGRFSFANGDVYEGKWVGDVPCGFGRLHFITGDIYEGQWENNAYHGQGALLNKKEGSCYVGEFKCGRRDGLGKVVDDATQRVLEEGHWVNNRLIVNVL